MGSITGRIGGRVFGYNLSFQASPTGLSGRIGGLVAGANLEVRVGDTGQVSGRMAGAVAGKDVSGLLSGSCFEGRIGGGVVGNDVRLERAGDHIAGRFGGSVVGHSCDITFTPTTGGREDGADGGRGVGGDSGADGGRGVGSGEEEGTSGGGRLRGRMGGNVFGCDLDLVVNGEVPPLLATLSAVVAYFRLLEVRSHRGGGSHD